MKRPYYESILSENTMIRGFSQSVSQSDLVWHRDRERRTIIVVEGRGWQFQRDNCLPELIIEGDHITVNAGEYHRLIKGDSDLIVTIIKEKKSDGSRSVKMGADNNPKVTKMDFLPNKVLKKIAKDKDLDEKKKKTDFDIGGQTQYRAGRSKKQISKQADLTRKYNAAKTEKQRQKYRDMIDRSREKEGVDELGVPLPAKESLIRLTENQLNELVEETVEAEKLAMMLEKIEELEEKKKKRKKKKKKKKGGGLSAAVKKSLDKKADKRGFTRGSVYTEFRKGLAAYYSSGSRKGMSAHQWAHARVNSANPSKSWASVKKRKGGKKK
jgi:hypothetical protein